MGSPRKKKHSMLVKIEKHPTVFYREFDPVVLTAKRQDEKARKKKIGAPKQWGHDPIGSVNVRISTLALIHRVREQMVEIGEEKVPLHEALDRVVKHYLDCAGDGAAQKISEHSR